MRQAAVFKWWKYFRDGEMNMKDEPIVAGLAQCLFHYHPEACGKWPATCF